jgi:hypothetical protein
MNPSPWHATSNGDEVERSCFDDLEQRGARAAAAQPR